LIEPPYQARPIALASKKISWPAINKPHVARYRLKRCWQRWDENNGKMQPARRGFWRQAQQLKYRTMFMTVWQES